MDEEFVKKVRGEIIHEMVDVENQMNYLISTYFCGHRSDKHSEVQLIILLDSRFNLDFKKDVVVYIIEKEFDKSFVEMYLSEFFTNKDQTLSTFISSLLQYRNAAAHFNWFPDVTKERINYKLVAVTHKAGKYKEKPPKIINREDVDIFIEKAVAFKNMLTRASNHLTHKNNDDK